MFIRLEGMFNYKSSSMQDNHEGNLQQATGPDVLHSVIYIVLQERKENINGFCSFFPSD